MKTPSPEIRRMPRVAGAVDMHRRVEENYNERVLKALAAAWDMAAERGLIEGHYVTDDGQTRSAE